MENLYIQKYKNVGALTSRKNVFRSRSWELNSRYYINFYDILLPTIRVDYTHFNKKPIRIISRFKKNVITNLWLSNKMRYYIFNTKIIIEKPVKRININGKNKFIYKN